MSWLETCLCYEECIDWTSSYESVPNRDLRIDDL